MTDRTKDYLECLLDAAALIDIIHKMPQQTRNLQYETDYLTILENTDGPGLVAALLDIVRRTANNPPQPLPAVANGVRIAAITQTWPPQLTSEPT